MSPAGEAPSLAVAAFGVSTPFAYWGFDLVRAVVQPSVARHGGGLAEWREALASGGRVALSSDLPDAGLVRFVLDADLPVIVFSDAPAVMLDWAMQSRGLGLEEAARLCARVCASLAPALGARRLLIATPEAAPAEIAAAVGEFLRPGQGGARETPLPPAPGRRPTEESLAMTAALAAYADLTLGRQPQEIVWPLRLFTRLDGRSWREPFDLAGPARALLYGPYMHLPAGGWTARVEFEIVGALSGVEATADVRVNEVVAERTFVMPARGVFAYELRFAVRDPHHPVEIRLFLRKAAIEGVFLARSVKLRREATLSSASR